MGRWKPHAFRMVCNSIIRGKAVSIVFSTDSVLETMERLQNGVGPRPEPPLLLRDQEMLWDYLTN